MAEFCKAKITWGENEVKVYEGAEPGESAELIDDTNLNSDAKEYVVSDLHDSDEFIIKVPESDASKFTVGDKNVMTITYTNQENKTVSFTAVCTKKANLALTRGSLMTREITLKKSGSGTSEVTGTQTQGSGTGQ